MDLGATPNGSTLYIAAYEYQEKPQTNLRTKIKSSGFRSKYNSHVGNDWSRIKMSIAEKKLRIAASTNNSEQVEQLCQNGVNVRCFDEHQRSPLHFAAAMGYSEVAEILLKHGADPNQKDKLGNTALHLAACTNHVPVVTLLLRAGTDITTIDNNGRTPMQLAQAKLKILQRSSSTQKEMSQVKDEVSGVLEMMREYLKKVLQSRDTDRPGGTEEVYSQLINSFSQRLSLHTSHSDLSNDLGNLLQSLGTLNLNTP
ncbi:ankyrin repeat domain-containing protein 54 [Eurytemora carolleeae]|uniref:ankyrin repeat domain-containing protein 54 n=1 Tax=Eurytemora carolleeae TaxID=1294199 RepID=UPI000C763657|nr:ankyrin repeat domain-containing protein 54 [Eurytemora carolleeae]|eukprot:XP_023323219.1 ankyrin repeat domain-containing protein 54-like [Eurytemora affinis]